MEEIGIPELNLEQLAKLCESAEQAARDYVLSKVPSNRIEIHDLTVEVEGTKPVTANVEVTVVLSPLMKGFDVDALTKEATKRAFANIEEYLRKLECKSKKY